jgi:MscS family membrane protein
VVSLTPVLKRTRTTADDELLHDIAGPLRLLLGIALFQAGLELIEPPVLLRAYLIRILTALAYFALAWFAVRIIDLLTAHLSLRMARQQLASARSVLPLGRRTAKVAVGTIAVLATLASWGYDTTAILAGLGVGGLAVALAAQKTIENLFGGLALTTDRPVLVGDFCRYGDRIGTVEDIGLRSTRIRSLDRTVVTIPNATFSSMTLENFAVRDRIFLNPRLCLRIDTTPEQIRDLIPALRGVMLNHPKVDPNPARVRFTTIGQWSLDLEIFAYVQTRDIDEFLIVQEQVLLGFMEVIEKAGTSIAIPARMNYHAAANAAGDATADPPPDRDQILLKS